MSDKPLSFAERYLKHVQERHYPTIDEISGIENWELNELQVSRATEIVRTFTQWDLDTGPCPISSSDRYWFKRLCALGEWIAILEAKLDPEAFTEEDEDPDGA